VEPLVLAAFAGWLYYIVLNEYMFLTFGAGTLGKGQCHLWEIGTARWGYDHRFSDWQGYVDSGGSITR
jgi:hypothetical protein